MIRLVIIILGLIASWILFNHFPELKITQTKVQEMQEVKLSIIIPARNEEKNLVLLLGDLKNQCVDSYEIICVDDNSEDNTAQIAKSFGIKVITLKDKPKGWIGKSWACQKGVDAATGNAFLFLDADVRLSKTGVFKLLNVYKDKGHVISVQPYHQMIKKYEALSLFFNCIQMGANGMGMPIWKNTETKATGLYGPVILIGAQNYKEIGGHAEIKESIVDDMALGERLREKGIPFSVFLGDGDVFYRMYPGGIKDLVQGWTKNQAAGAMKIPLTIFLLVFFWFTSCAAVPLYLCVALIQYKFLSAYILAAFYIAWILELHRIIRHIGNFKRIDLIIYPIFLVFYLMIFIRSMTKKVFRLKVTWKDRKIRLEK